MSETNIDDSFEEAAEPTATASREDILAALSFSVPREVPTKRGPRLVSSAKPSSAFKAMAETPDGKAWLYENGYTYGPDRKGILQVSKWEKVPEKILVERKEAIEMSRATDAAIDVPRPEGLEYLGYQRAGIAFGHTRPAVLIGDEMGLGKTIQAIGILNCMLTEATSTPRVLIVCPASLKLNWKRELEKWLIRKLAIFVADSRLFPDLTGVVIINYDVLHKHEAVLAKLEFDLLVVDEAHYLKNANARRSKMVFGIRATAKQRAEGIPDVPGIRAKKRVFLTGTPIANRPAEIFPLISYLDPIAWPDFFRFAVRYCNGHRRQFSASKSGWDFTGSSHLDELQDKLRSTIMIRRLKKDVLTELPPKRRQVIELPASGDALLALRAERDAYEGNSDEIVGMQAEVELSKTSDDPAAYSAAVAKLAKGQSGLFSELSTLRRETALSKIPAALEHIREAAEESAKIVVFAHHKAVVAALAAEFGDEAVSLVGDTPMQERQDAVDRFQKDPNCRVFIGSIMAAGVGITLTAAAHVIFFELDWVPGNVSQAEDRCHRIGQKESVLVQHLVLEGSLDAVMARRIIAKQDVIDRALDTTRAALAPEGKAQTEDVRRETLEAEAAALSDDKIEAATIAIKRIAAMCNGARDWDGAGFSKIDTRLGKSLAEQTRLSRKQAALALRLAIKYRRQLPEDLVLRLQPCQKN